MRDVDRFINPRRITADQRRLIAELRDQDDALRIFGAAVSETRGSRFATANGLRRSSGHVCITRLIAGRCDGTQCLAFPGADHSSLWLRDGKPAAFVTQPYHLSGDTLRKIMAFCVEHGLQATVDAGLSWHFPGWTVAVVVTRDDGGRTNEYYR